MPGPRIHGSRATRRPRATDLTGLPPTYIVAAERCPLRDEDIEYALRLLRAGVSVELHSYAGAFHGFMELAPSAEISVRAQREIIDALRRTLTPRTLPKWRVQRLGFSSRSGLRAPPR